MARARNIKPGLYKNEDLAECSIWARYIFPGLWMLADREGRLEDRPKRIKAELLPFDSAEIGPLLDELQAMGFLVRYQNSDGSFIQISKFSEHQTPHYSEKKSVIKPPSIQETRSDYGRQIPGVFSEKPKKEGLIKGGSQPPDSLIPDSPIPDSRKKEAAPDGALDPVWGPGLQILTSAGVPEGHARSFLGALLGTWESSDVLEALQASSGKADPRGYVRGILKSKPKKSKLGNGSDPVLSGLREKWGPEVRLASDGRDYWLPESNRRWFLDGRQKAAM